MPNETTVAAMRPADTTIIWRSYIASKETVCAALAIPVPLSSEIYLEMHDGGIRVTIKTLENKR